MRALYFVRPLYVILISKNSLVRLLKKYCCYNFIGTVAKSGHSHPFGAVPFGPMFIGRGFMVDQYRSWIRKQTRTLIQNELKVSDPDPELIIPDPQYE